MEMLRIHRITGEALAERDLTGRTLPLTIGSAEAADLSLATYLRPGDAPVAPIAAALVRDEDGWRLAAADPAQPLSLGEATVLEVRLVPGVAGRLGDFVLRVEGTAQAHSAVSLLWAWRGLKGTYRADLQEGRNEVAMLPGSDLPGVNPPVAGAPLCRLVLEDESLTILMPEREGGTQEWLRVGLGEGFRVGDFTGVALATAEAEKALKTRRPLAWPGRAMRGRLSLYLACGVMVGLLMLMVAHQIREVKAVIAARDALCRERPAAVVAAVADHSTLGDDVRVYELDFHRSLPGILQAERQPNADFLLERGAALLARAAAETNTALVESLDRKLALLRGIRAIKVAVGALAWEDLRNAVADLDEAAFRYYDAEAFLGDARELSVFVTETLPALFAAAASAPIEAFKQADQRLMEGMEGLRDNRFAAKQIAATLQETALLRWEALRAAVDARAALQANPCDDAVMGQAVDAFSTLEDRLGEASESVAQLVELERQKLSTIACAAARGILDKGAELRPMDERPLRALAQFLRAIGGDGAVAQEATQAANAVARNYTRQWRALHTQYRLQTIAGKGEAAATLDAMLALGPSDSAYYQWAVRERARLAALAQEATPNAQGGNND